MFQRFTERARRIVFFAQEEAGRLGENYVSTEHFLLGLVRENDSVAAKVFQALDVSPKLITQEIMRQVIPGEAKVSPDMQLTPRSKRVIDLAYDESRITNLNYIGTEHLLIGLIREGEGLAGRVLAKLGVTLERTREEVNAIRAIDGQVPVGTAKEVQTASPQVSPSVRGAIEIALLRMDSAAMNCLRNAQTEAANLGAKEVMNEHLLFSLIANTRDRSAHLLQRLGYDLTELHTELFSLIQQAEPITNLDLPFAASLDRILIRAYSEARNADKAWIGTEHLLLGLVREQNGIVGEVFTKLGAEKRIREEIAKSVETPQEPEPEAKQSEEASE